MRVTCFVGAVASRRSLSLTLIVSVCIVGTAHSQVRELVREGDAAPGTEPGVTFDILRETVNNESPRPEGVVSGRPPEGAVVMTMPPSGAGT
jgi:hypothetical protein